MTTKVSSRRRKQPRTMRYPKAFQVEWATQLQLARWLWLLPAVSNNEQRAIRDRIKERFQGWTQHLYRMVDWTNRTN